MLPRALLFGSFGKPIPDREQLSCSTHAYTYDIVNAAKSVEVER